MPTSLSRSLAAAGPATLLAILPACGSSDAARRSAMSAQATAAVARISAEVEAIRGLAFLRPVAAEVQSREEANDGLRAMQQRVLAPDEVQAMAETLVLLDFLSPEADLARLLGRNPSAGILGYYDYESSETFYLVGKYSADWSFDMIVAHELCHALEDQHFDLGAFTEGIWTTFDRQVTRRSVFEGSATAVMNHYMMDRIGRDIREADLENLKAGLESFVSSMTFEQSHEDFPAAFGMASYLAYTEGSKFVTRNAFGYGVPEKEAWDRLWRDPPRSSEQILHPEKYWDAASRDDPIDVALPEIAAALGEGWARVREGVIGELWTAFVLAYEIPTAREAEEGRPLEWRTSAAQGWGGDHYQLYRGPGGANLLLWAVAWDSDVDREEFLDALLEVHQARNDRLRLVHAEEEVPDHVVVAVFADDAGAAVAAPALSAILDARPAWR